MHKLKLIATFLTLFAVRTISGAESENSAPASNDLLTSAVQLYKQERYHDSLVYTQASLKKNPKDAGCLYNLGLCQAALKEHRAAINSFTLAIKLDPSLCQAWAERGASRDILGDKSGAVSDYTQALNFDKEPPAKLFFQRALAFFSIGNFAKAASDFSRCGAEPKLSEATWYLALCDEELHRFDAAISTLNSYIAHSGGDTKSYAKRADLYMQLGQFPRAVHDYTEALRLAPELPDALEKRSIAFARLGKAQQSIQDANELIKTGTARARGYSTRAYAQLAAGDRRGAQGDCAACRSLTNRDYLEHYVSALLFKQKSEVGFALAELALAIALNPSFEESYSARGELECEQGHYTLAEADFRKWSELSPRSAQAKNDLGYVQLKQSHWQAALATLDQALRLAPGSAEAYSNRGFTQLHLNNVTEAVSDCKSAIKYNPKLANAHYYLALALERAGESKLAEVEFSEASKLDPQLALAPIAP